MLIIDGAYGEGGGQIIRSTLTLSILLGRSVRIENIRANRKQPGLAAQHLLAVQASAMLCDAEVVGAELGSTRLTFVPRSPPQAGFYEFDVATARPGGSAGATTLVLQTVLLPLVQAHGASEVTLRGGTHVAWSPSFHYIRDVYLPTLAEIGISADVTLSAWGWFPAGLGEVRLIVPDHEWPQSALPSGAQPVTPQWRERSPLRQVRGMAVASSLPAHIAQRMQQRATKLLEEAGLPANIEPVRVRSVSPGAGLFLVGEYEQALAGFSALGEKGKPSEQVAEEVVAKVLQFHQSGAVFDPYLVDQLILPLALSGQAYVLTAETLSSHTLTNLWVVEQFLGPVAQVDYGRKSIRFTQRESVL